jgi:peptidyl-tRNA hydrolase, PTH2 family
MSNIKQVIVIRKDLNMSAGKLASQVSHASMALVTNLLNVEKTLIGYNYNFHLDEDKEQELAIHEWLQGSFTKVIVYVKSEQALLNIYEKAKVKNLPCALIKDEGRTEFNGVPTHTCLGIGPCHNEDFEGITSKLRLFNGEVIPK